MERQTVLVIDFGGQYNQLIARRVREQNVYCEVRSYRTPVETLLGLKPKGIILTGGPADINDADAPKLYETFFSLGVPVLGICYGAQLIAHQLGGSVEKSATPEYGNVNVKLGDSTLFEGCEKNTTVWMSHTNQIARIPAGFTVTAHTDGCTVAAFENAAKKIYGVQFHPEVNHTPDGNKYLKNFLFSVCGLAGDWVMSEFAKSYVADMTKKLEGKKVLCALSGGVDSSVAATLLAKIVGPRLTCIFVDTGLMRLHEGDEVERVFGRAGGMGLNFVRVDAEKRFLTKLAGVSDPEKKRKIIGEEFIRVFEEEAIKIGEVDCLVQGTIYPDVIESGIGNSAVIKSHHNVGGLPKNIKFKELIEPLRDLFKDEVRRLGRELGLPEYLVMRQPFPGPGLAVRVIGDITKDKLDTLRKADFIFRDEIAKNGLDSQINQYFAIITDMRSVGVMGDERTYDHTLALRAVTTTDFMTADWAEIPYAVLKSVSSRIVNEVKHINRIVYDITTKPPATIEWE